MDIITGYLGEAHITAEQDRDINIGIVGDGSYVMPAGQRLAAEVSSNNEVRIRDGVIMHQGCAASIKKNTYDPVTIINGSQGMKRIDLIVARYERNVETGVETIDLVVLQGTPAEGSPETPEYTEGDIQSGDTVADMPLYEVQIDGLNITGVEKVFEEIESLKALNGNTLKIATHTEVYTVQGNNIRRIQLSLEDFGITNGVKVKSGYVEVRTENPSLYQGTFNPDDLVLYIANDYSNVQNIPCIVYLFYTEL